MLNRKGTLIAAAAAVTMLFAPTPSKADVDIRFGIGLPGFGVYTDRGDRYRHYNKRHYNKRRYRHSNKLTCREARRLVRYNGFRRIRALDCSGRMYTFKARRYGELYKVRVNSRRGAIARIRRL